MNGEIHEKTKTRPEKDSVGSLLKGGWRSILGKKHGRGHAGRRIYISTAVALVLAYSGKGLLTVALGSTAAVFLAEQAARLFI